MTDKTAMQGFTLLELILFLIVASIAATMLVTYSMQSRHTVSPATGLETRARLQTGMETLVIDYKKRMAAGNFTLSSFRSYADSISPAGVAITTEMVKVLADDPPILKITVSLEGQSLCALFTQ